MRELKTKLIDLGFTQLSETQLIKKNVLFTGRLLPAYSTEAAAQAVAENDRKVDSGELDMDDESFEYPDTLFTIFADDQPIEPLLDAFATVFDVQPAAA